MLNGKEQRKKRYRCIIAPKMPKEKGTTKGSGLRTGRLSSKEEAAVGEKKKKKKKYINKGK